MLTRIRRFKTSILRRPVKSSMGACRIPTPVERMRMMAASITKKSGMGVSIVCVKRRRNANNRRKSTLRKLRQEPLGPQYRGFRVARDDVFAGGSDSYAGQFDSSSEAEDEDEDQWALDTEPLGQDDSAVWDNGSNKIRKRLQMDASDQSDGSEFFGEADQEELGSSSFKERGSSGFPGKEATIDMDDGDAIDSFDEGSEGEDEDTMAIEGGSIDADARFRFDDGDAFDDEASEMDKTDSSSDEASSEHEPGSNISDEADVDNKDERATLRQMMAESQKAVVATIAEASKVDVAKGEAIAHQRSSFDALLNTRIHLQKGIIAMNSFSSQDISTLEDDRMASVVSNAEAAALRLWNGLDELRQALQPSPPPAKKRHVSPATHSTSTAAMWERMQSHEAQFIPTRRATLTKWSSRLQPLAVDRGRATLSGTSDYTPLTTVLDQHLAAPNRARLLARSRVPRSCAPVQAAAQIPSDPEIYDDADFYATLLRELVDRRMTDRASGSAGMLLNHNDSNPAAAAASSSSSRLLPFARDRKPRGQVDTRASKGRKMRYAVHEKLQNFMAPEDRGSWGERQTAELFAGLLGQKRIMVEDGEDDEDDDDDEDSDDGDGVKDTTSFNVGVNGRHAGTNGHSAAKKKKQKERSKDEDEEGEEEEEEEEAWMMFHRGPGRAGVRSLK